MSESGRIAIMTSPGSLAFAEYPAPEAGPGCILARVSRTNVCGSEIHIWCGHHPTKRSGGLGHEMVGMVEKLGEGVTCDSAGAPLSVGDRIVATYFIACRRCNPCQHGQFNLCTNAYQFWGRPPEQEPHFHTTFGTFHYIHPDQYVYRVPDNVSDRAASSANCALSQVYFGVDEAQLTSGENVVIQGAGGLGLNAAAVARARGARVIVIDAVSARLDQARRFGAHETILMADYPDQADRIARVKELTGGHGADLVIEVAGVPAAFNEALLLARAGGRGVGMGNISPGQTVAIDPGLLTRTGVRILPIMRYQPWYLKKALDFLSDYKDTYPFDELVDAEFTLDQIEEALARSVDRTVTRASILIGEG